MGPGSSRTRFACPFVCLVALLALAGSGAPIAAAAGCPNEELRQQQGVAAGDTALPSCMALEMVSPPKKLQQYARSPRVSADGERIAFGSNAALADTPGRLHAFEDIYVASRGDSGWSPKPTVGSPELTKGIAQAQSFTPDLSSWFFPALGTVSESQLGIAHAYRGGLGQSLTALSPELVPIGGYIDISKNRSQGASGDHSSLFFQIAGRGELGANMTPAYLPGDPEPAGPSAETNLYVAGLDPLGQPSLQLVARDAQGKIWGGNCGAHIGGLGAGGTNRGAISADGSLAYFSTRAGQASGACNPTANKLRILRRIETSAGPWISELIASECTRIPQVVPTVIPACGETPAGALVPDADDLYQVASVDGTKVYFTTLRQLASSDLDATSDLYLYDSTRPLGQRLTQVSAGGVGDATPGQGANVAGTVAVSGDGSHAYFISSDVLTTAPGPEGKVAQTGQPNLYLYERDAAHPGGATVFVAALGPGGSVGRSYPVPLVGEDSQGSQVGGDGHFLFLFSAAPLTADDTDSSTDLFRYDAAGAELVRISKAGPGGSDGGGFSASVDPFGTGSPGTANNIGTDFAERVRWASEDGQTAVFQTAEGLLGDDLNGLTDSYLWHAGQLSRLPGTSGLGDPKSNGNPSLSHDGFSVAFQTDVPLLPQDGDTVQDVYVARVLGGFPFAVEAEPCQPDAALAGRPCQQSAGFSPSSPSLGTAGAGAGNVRSIHRVCPKHKRLVRRGGKTRCVKKSGHKKRASHKQGDQK